MTFEDGEVGYESNPDDNRDSEGELPGEKVFKNEKEQDDYIEKQRKRIKLKQEAKIKR